MTRIAICGVAGRMGQVLTGLVEAAPDLALAGGIDRTAGAGVCTPDQARPLLEQCDVIIDFSAPPALRALLAHPAEAWSGRALVTGTTGLEPADHELLTQLAQHAAVISASNFSVGVNLLVGLVESAARVLTAEQFDAEIVEAHHRRKVDAPSGTALTLAEALARGRRVELEAVRRDGRSGDVGARPTGEIGLHAVRGGAVVGEHRVTFFGDAERIELAHVATDRRLFAEGALHAARWAAGRAPGRYSMQDVLGL